MKASILSALDYNNDIKKSIIHLKIISNRKRKIDQPHH